MASSPGVSFFVLITASITADLTALSGVTVMLFLQNKAQLKKLKNPFNKTISPWCPILCYPMAKSCEEKWCRTAGGKRRAAVVIRIP